MSMFEKLDSVDSRFEQVSMKLQDPNILGDQGQYRALMKEHADLTPIVTAYRRFRAVGKQLEEAKQLLANESDPDLRQMAKEEIGPLESEFFALEEQIKILILPKDPNDEKNIVLEIRSGAGGDEASLFASELFDAYNYYAASQGWKVDVLSSSEGNAGGFREIIAEVSGEKVFSKLKFESGVHRVQRVPATETQGRVHTSTVTVAVIPEAEEVDVVIDPNDLRIDVFRSSGKGGQSVNTTDSAVRITHIPSGLVISSQTEKSQHKNKAKGMKVLMSRLKAIEDNKAMQSASEARLAQIGTGDRSERIRTYNFPQSRITDHRIGLTIPRIDAVMKGEMGWLIDPLVTHFQAEQLKNQNEAR